jgi:signal transduction histidine kinase/ligand-binding sensor domain-containing protein
MNRRFLFIAFILLSFHKYTHAQQISFTPIYYKLEKSISFLGITQDPLGYIWISSKGSGIYRYDGREFINFQHNDSNANSLSANWTECILADSADIIWIGTFGKGLDKYDPVTNTFIHFKHDPKNNSSIGSDTVTALIEDHDGNLWIGNYGGLDMLDSKSGKFVHYTHQDNDPHSLSSNKVRSVYEDHKGTIWVGCGSPFPGDGRPEDGGLNRFNKVKGNFTRFVHDPADPNSLATNKVKALFEDSKGNFWVGTSGDGLHMMNREKGTFTHFYYDSLHPERLSRPPLAGISFDHITFINEDLTGKIWIGSLASGINRYDPETKKITHFGGVLEKINAFPNMKDTTSGFTDFSTWQALFSKDGSVWITTLFTFISDGRYLYNANPFKKKVPFYPISKPGANTFYDDGDSILWIGTDGGLIKKNLKLQTEKLYVHDPKIPNSLSGNGINVIRVDNDRNFWLGTSYGGLDKFDPHSNLFKSYRFDGKNENSLANDSIWSMCLDHNNDLWVGTSNGIDKMNKQTGEFTHFKPGKSQIRHIVYCIREDRSNEIWVGSGKGLYRINIGSGVITTVLPIASVKSICVDSKNDIWIGADTLGTGEQSLYRFDRSRNQFISFTDPNSKNRITDVFDIMEDDNKRLWVSTTNAMYKISEKRDTVRNYGESSGVHANNFGTGDNFKSASGQLFFGDSKGYYSFLPDELKDNGGPGLNFTSFKLNGSEVIPAAGGILTKPLWRTNEIGLNYNQNSFSIEFFGVDYRNAGEIKYLFMLENYDDGWHKIGTEHRPYYFNVPPGRYVFHARAFNDAGISVEKTITIVIYPPWWETWWAYTIFAVLIAGALWGFIYYRSLKLRRENRLLEEKVAHRTNQLNQSLEELKATQTQLVQSEKMASLGELTAGIAHEIQNPLNFVNNFSEVNAELIAEMKEEINKGNMDEVRIMADNIEENERKIIHHGKRADAIVKGMLQHSRTSSGQKEPTDLNALTDEYFRLSYHGLRAKDKNVNAIMQTDYDSSIGRINLIPQDMGRVLLNLFNNAFYSVTEKKLRHPAGFEPEVSVRTLKTGNTVEVRIKDNGMGVPQKILDKIFQPFFTTKPTGSGTGLGLSMSYDIIKAHAGELKVESVEGQGAEFIIRVPVA